MTTPLRILALGLICFGLALAPRLVEAREGWRVVKGGDLGFTVEMPSKPQRSIDPMKTPRGTSYDMFEFVSEKDSAGYVLQTAIYPSDVDVSDPKTNLKNALAGAARALRNGEWKNVNWLKKQGYPAYDAVGRKEGLDVRQFAVMRGSQIYIMTYAGLPGTALSEDVDYFIRSLKLDE